MHPGSFLLWSAVPASVCLPLGRHHLIAAVDQLTHLSDGFNWTATDMRAQNKPQIAGFMADIWDQLGQRRTLMWAHQQPNRNAKALIGNGQIGQLWRPYSLSYSQK